MTFKIEFFPASSVIRLASQEPIGKLCPLSLQDGGFVSDQVAEQSAFFTQ